jgi:hypothetical protein
VFYFSANSFVSDSELNSSKLIKNEKNITPSSRSKIFSESIFNPKYNNRKNNS